MDLNPVQTLALHETPTNLPRLSCLSLTGTTRREPKEIELHMCRKVKGKHPGKLTFWTQNMLVWFRCISYWNGPFLGDFPIDLVPSYIYYPRMIGVRETLSFFHHLIIIFTNSWGTSAVGRCRIWMTWVTFLMGGLKHVIHFLFCISGFSF